MRKPFKFFAIAAVLLSALTVCASAAGIGGICFTGRSVHAETEIYDGGTMFFVVYDSAGKMKEVHTVELLTTALYKSVSADFEKQLTISDTVKAFLVRSGTLAPVSVSASASPLIVGEITERHALLVIAAENYLDAFPMSRDGLVEQLMYDGYSLDDAVFAVMYADADWMAQARQSALNYMQYVGGFTKTSLLRQLLSDKYTYAQAVYGVSAAFP